ncbi:hypothetical protein COV04_00880 [Candidatus Uhrbacteria bacterium CG10_big_fil_rev_8_21_14_0_10_48_11]|uniref:Glycerophosphoryl diester phosphodiesterase membrane domain-containing protein n=1 Tax=Candidatus Uhrbacteria bacterium CG10_big_fil_rev_8_21_14_0_10_48_11 TaxID=1975037 RepID=A0A2M8LF47_9BACT|nr:MAG: hypothetical protein COV04_00880 [Candidatus Uhrbacteria bacterium CG10_big_fil_rev_8_21_14_0_10_48_11]
MLFSSKQSSPIPGPLALLREATELYRQQFGRLIALLLVAIFAVVIGVFIALGILAFFSVLATSTSSALQSIGIVLSIALELVALLGLAVMQMWASLSVVVALNEGGSTLSIRETYRKARRFILPYFWVSVLSGLLTFGGIILLIIPGVILLLWFVFVLYIVVAENERGVNVLLASRNYVHGHWWAVAWRMLFLVLISIVFTIPASIVTTVFNQPGLAQAINFTLELLLTPLLLAYTFVLYRHLRSFASAPVPEEDERWRRIFVIGGTVMAFIAIILLATILTFGISAL